MTRIIADAGAFGFADRWIPVAKLFDAVITKTITLQPTEGRPRAIYKVRGGLINNVGLANCGVDEYIRSIYKDDGVNKIISIHADTILEYVEIIEAMNTLQCEAIELNLSCPNVPNTKLDMRQLLHAVQRASEHKIIAKLSPYQDYVETMLSVGNTLRCVHIANTQPVVFVQDGNRVRGGFSGRSMKYAALKATADIRELRSSIEIIAGGGVYSRQDVLDYVAMGADDVSVCSSVAYNPIRAWWLSGCRKV